MDSYINRTFNYNQRDFVKETLKIAVNYFLYHPEKIEYDILVNYIFPLKEYDIFIPDDISSNEKLCIIYTHLLNRHTDMNKIIRKYLKSYKGKITYAQKVFLTILITVILSESYFGAHNVNKYIRQIDDVNTTKIRIQKDALKHALIDEKSTFKTLTRNPLYDINLAGLISSMITYPCKILSTTKIQPQDEKKYDNDMDIPDKHIIVENSDIKFLFETNYDIINFLQTSLRYLFKIKLKDKIKYVIFGYKLEVRTIYLFSSSGSFEMMLYLDSNNHYFSHIVSILIAIKNELENLE